MDFRPRTIQFLLALLLAVAMLTGCEISLDFPDPGIGEIVTCTELTQNMTCVDRSAVFDGRTPINASALAAGLKPGDEIEMIWLQEETELKRMPLAIEKYGSFPVASWLIPQPVLPNGEYTVRFLLNGEAQQQATVEVVGAEPELTGLIFCKSAPEAATCDARTDAFDGTNPLHILAIIAGANETDQLSTELILVDRVVAEASGRLQSSTVYTTPITFTPEPALMTGDYLLEIYLNDQLAERVPVAIEGPPPGVFDVTTCSEVDETKQCTEPADSFSSQETIYAVVRMVGMMAGEEVIARWFYGDEEIGLAPYLVEQEGNGAIAFHFKPNASMPEGRYQVDILFRDEVAAAANFLVEHAEGIAVSPLHAARTCRQVTQEYECIEPTQTYAPTDTLFVLLDLVDLAAGETVTAVWFAGDEVADEVRFTSDSGGSGSIYFDFVPDGSFKPGDYAVEVYIGDSLSERLEMRVLVEE